MMMQTDYVGQVMELCQEKRGTMKDMEYMNERRVVLRYDMPLSEIIYDLFNQLKSRTRGYASLDYELIGYKKSDLVKLDILINGEVVDALSFIVHQDKAYNRGRQIKEGKKRMRQIGDVELPQEAFMAVLKME